MFEARWQQAQFSEGAECIRQFAQRPTDERYWGRRLISPGVLHVRNDSLDPTDRRVKRTQRLLAEALIALTLEKGYDAVTIRDITERADVGYATFFRHYSDKDALLHDVAHVVMQQLLDLLPKGDPTEMGVKMFEYLRVNSAVCRVLLGSHGSMQMLAQIAAQGAELVLRDHTPRPDSVIPPEIAAQHMVASLLALIQWWLDHDMPYPPDKMGEIYQRLIVQPVMEHAFQD